MYVVKTKVLIRCLVTVQLTCTFVFTYSNRFSHDVANINCVIISVVYKNCI